MTDLHLRQFLLRRLPPDEAARLEESILLQEGVAERLRDEEFDLLDDYAAGRLNAADAAAVARHWLTSAQAGGSLRAARAWRQSLLLDGGDVAAPVEESSAIAVAGAREPSLAAEGREARARGKTPPFQRVGTLLAAALAIIALIPLWRWAPEPPAAPPTRRAPGGAVPAVAPPVEAPPVEAPPVAGSGLKGDASWPVITLLADLQRGPAPQSLRIARTATVVRLQAEVPGRSVEPRYALVVADARGRRLFAESSLMVQAAGPYRFVEVVVPAAALAPGARSITLSAAGAAQGVAPKYTWQVSGVRD